MNFLRKADRDTDVESGVDDVGIQHVDSADDGVGFETSFLIVNPSLSDDVDGDNLSWQGTYLCRPYRREKLLEEIANANRCKNGQGAILNALKNAGVTIFIIDSKVSTTTADIMESVHNIISHITKASRSRPYGHPETAPRCLLYRDHDGRFFNLTLAEHTVSAAGSWKSISDNFSSTQALVVLTILCRSFACATELSVIENQFQPAYLSLILGLVFSEEIGMAWTNVGMHVRGMPSFSAFTITSEVESDWIRKAIVLLLALGAANTGTTQLVMTMTGISLACATILANLGSRAWGFLQWRPFGFGGPFESLLAFVVAAVVGAIFPFMGHRQVASGGHVAMESIIRIALLVAACFVVSDFDAIQRFLVIGSELCSQKYVNLFVGGWWGLTFLLSLWKAYRTESLGVWPARDEPFMEASNVSPVGFLVPNLPSFPIDPKTAKRGIQCVNDFAVLVIGSILAIAVTVGICYLSFTDVDEEFYDNLENGNGP